MNVKVLGGGALVVLGIGGFMVYNEIAERREARKREAEVAADRANEAEKKQATKDRVEKSRDVKWATLPDLRGKSESDARKELTEAGFQQIELEVLEARYECDYDGDPKSQSDMVPVDTICQQDPIAGGRMRAEKVRIEVVIEHDTWERGGLATSEWKRMPDVLNMTLPEAQALLASKGFAADEFEVEDYTHSCPPSKVCETLPAPGLRKRKDTQGTIRASLK